MAISLYDSDYESNDGNNADTTLTIDAPTSGDFVVVLVSIGARIAGIPSTATAT